MQILRSPLKPFSFFVVFVITSLIAVPSLADKLASFEPDACEFHAGPGADFVDRNCDNFQWDAYDGGNSYGPSWGYLGIDGNTGALGSSSSLKLTVTGGRSNPYQTPVETCGSEISSLQEAIDNPENICSTQAGGFNYWFLNSDRTQGMPHVAGANRISFYAKIPSQFIRKLHNSGEPENYTMHFGTYTRDPSVSYPPGANLGRHFYHWMNFKGTGEFWTKIIIDEHPQHEVGVGGEDPGDNPTSGFNYIEGLTRFYFKNKSYLINNTWSLWIDEFDVYHDPRPMPPKIATIAITQIATTDFEVDFASVDEGGGDSNVNTYEVRYSTSPIVDANYDQAEVVSGSPAITGDWERYAHAEAYGLNISGANVIYFAIKQLDENSDSIAYAEYQLNQSTGLLFYNGFEK